MFYFVYMIKSISSQKSKTYVGYTNNIQNRLLQHNTNKGAKSTKGYKWEIIYKKKWRGVRAGRMCRTRNAVYTINVYRGFESHPLRNPVE